MMTTLSARLRALVRTAFGGDPRATTLSIPAEIYTELGDHLNSTEEEQVAFLFTHPADAGEELRVAEIYRVPPEGFELQSEYHVSLNDDVRGYVIKRAWDLGGSLVEVHSHAGDPPVWFSPSDLSGFEEWVPHVRWRLKGRSYIALVFAGASFDALVWEGDGDMPTPLAGLAVDGQEMKTPSSITYRRLSKGP